MKYKIFIFLCAVFLFDIQVRSAEPEFKVIAFYSASWDGAHISFAHEANTWFPEMAKKYNFVYDSTNNWSNLNKEFLSQYSVVLFLDNQPSPGQYAAFEEYMKNGGSWMGFHVVAFNQDPSAWDWYYNQLLGMGSYKSNTWAPTPAVLDVEDTTHPATKNLPDTFRTAPNEWYAWTVDLKKKANIKILCSINPVSFPLGDGSGSGGVNEIWTSGYYPVVWTNTNYNMLYINMGHNLVDYGKNNKTLSWTFKNEYTSKLVLDGLFWLASKNKPDPRASKISFLSPKNGDTFKEPATFEVNVNATDSDGVAKVEFYLNDSIIGEDSVAPYSISLDSLKMKQYDIKARCIDSLNNAVSYTISINVQGEGPYNKTKAVIPGKIEVENFDYGGEGVGYSDSEASNQGGQYRTAEGVDIETCSDAGGGFNIGYTAAKEWLKYSIKVSSGGYFTLQARVATKNSGKYFHVELDGQNISGKISVPNTGDWQTWKTVNIPISNISAGENELKIVFDTDGFNINYLNFTHDTITEARLIKTNKMSVFPNPSQGVFKIKMLKPIETNSSISVYDSQSKNIKTLLYSEIKGKNEIQLDLSAFPKGQYFLLLSKEKESLPVVLN